MTRSRKRLRKVRPRPRRGLDVDFTFTYFKKRTSAHELLHLRVGVCFGFRFVRFYCIYC
jgi:hypothetical protein